MKKFLLLLVFVSIGYSGTIRESLVQNWNGYLDTAYIDGILVDRTKKYTKWFKLSDYRALRLLTKCNDTAETGFANDSVNFEYGFQTGNVTLNSSGLVDTCIDVPIAIDTMVADSFGVTNNGVYNVSDGSITRIGNSIDTSSVSGFAVKSNIISFQWDCLVRFWVNSLGDPSKDDSGILLEFEVKREIYDPVRMK